MPPKVAKRGTDSQSQQAIANTQSSSSEEAVQPDAETQGDADTQVDDDASSTVNSQVIDDAPASTADGAVASTADTAHSSADDAETETKPAVRPAGKKAPAVATDTKDGEAKKKRRRKQDFSSFAIYIWKVLKQIHPDSGISKNAMQIMNDFIKDLFARIAELACDLCKKLKKATLQARDIQTATKLILPGALAKHAEGEACKALVNFNKHTKQGLR
ncbi:hypothetical protein E4T44_01932 [Aureobasidium sp. EXF-8845]|nr:hypothetical protein E4T44_01932 [Aureobasidium sp. EXF-8845]KAI4856309.1 hypothetical protein E4T45_02234 [Aureobasidium sp. EXF-8846]